jgi:DNA mismatch repair protein MutS
MQIDAATRRNLELTRSLSGGREGALLAAIDRTLTGGRRAAAGAAAGRRRPAIWRRSARGWRGRRAGGGRRCCASALRAALRRVPDIDRALSRLALDRGGPRDLAAMRDGLAQAARIAGRWPGPAAAAGRGRRA